MEEDEKNDDDDGGKKGEIKLMRGEIRWLMFGGERRGVYLKLYLGFN